MNKTALEPTPVALVFSLRPKPDLNIPGFTTNVVGDSDANTDDSFLLLSFDKKVQLDPEPGQYSNRLGKGIFITKEWALTELQIQDQFYENKRLFSNARERKPVDYNYHIVPQTFQIPEENGRFYLEAQQNKQYRLNRMYYFRPSESDSAQSVFIDSDYRRLVHGRHGLVSLHDAPLTYDGYKFDMKFKILVTSIDPLIAFYRPLDGKVRFATKKYQKPQKDSSPEIHIPTDENARSTDWFFNETDSAPHNFGFYDFQDIPPAPLSRYFRRQINRVLTQTLVGIYPRMIALNYETPQYNAFEYFEASLYVTPWAGVKLYDIHSISDVPNDQLLQAMDLVGLRVNLGPNGEFVNLLERDYDPLSEVHSDEVLRGAQVSAD